MLRTNALRNIIYAPLTSSFSSHSQRPVSLSIYIECAVHECRALEQILNSVLLVRRWFGVHLLRHVHRAGHSIGHLSYLRRSILCVQCTRHVLVFGQYARCFVHADLVRTCVGIVCVYVHLLSLCMRCVNAVVTLHSIRLERCTI
jgi:hypothetical protein